MSHLRKSLLGLMATVVGALTCQASRAEGLFQTLPKTGESFRRFELKLIPTSIEKPETATVRGLVAKKLLRKTHNLTNVLRELVVSAAGNTIGRRELDSRAREVLPRQIRPLVLIALNQSGFYRDDGKLTKSGSTEARDVEFQRGRLTSKSGMRRVFSTPRT